MLIILLNSCTGGIYLSMFWSCFDNRRQRTENGWEVSSIVRVPTIDCDKHQCKRWYFALYQISMQKNSRNNPQDFEKNRVFHASVLHGALTITASVKFKLLIDKMALKQA